ncbi:PQQ-dependent sugar dehydrogenase [Maribacter sp. 2307ULW6-5]|uniref:PQQ-dependent sugar dehydrogenase n=1 Tax=Maribacter sp. 2307ULW6-5 TaxID=3386275 RepID=UPI0039BCA0B7
MIGDLTSMVSQNNNRFGFKGFAFHPDYGLAGSPNSRYVYMTYLPNGRDKLLSRFTVSASGTIDLNTEQVLIRQRVPAGSYHSYGELAFGLDGFLYITSGDGSGGNSAPYPEGYDINTIMNLTQEIDNNLLGGILRIDVDRDPTRSHPPVKRLPQVFPSETSGNGYWIPNDNPWLDPNGSIMEEYYSLGVRNPWKLTIDPLTGTPWFADVGPSNGEEINRVSNGDNFGWPYRVGATGEIAWDNRSPTAPEPNPYRGNLTEPVFSPERSLARSIIVGPVYRGDKWPELYGKILAADASTVNVWMIDFDEGTGQVTVEDFPARPTRTFTYFETPSGDIMLIGQNGVLYALNKTEGETSEIPALLSQTGAFSNMTTLSTVAGILPYTVNTPLWSDDAEKLRWIALPSDGNFNAAREQIIFSEENPWEFPEGTVFIKHFELALDKNRPDNVRRIETRFTIVGDQGNVYGVTYQWRPNGLEADLVAFEGATEDFVVTGIGGEQYNQTWTYPSQNDCLNCHNPNAGQALGVNTQQLNRNYFYAATGVTDNQLNTWNFLNLFNRDIGDPNDYYHNVPLDDPLATNEFKVRSYLDANCAYCHMNNGVEAVFDARLSVALREQNLLNTAPTSSVSRLANVVAPGNIAGSELWARDVSTGSDAMPPLGRSFVDQEYIAALEAWIVGLQEDNNVIGEVGSVSLDHNWQRVNFNGSYSDPIIIAGGLTMNGSQTAMVRVRNVTPTGCEIQVDEWDCQDGVHFQELVSYLVVERGVHTLQGDLKIVAGKSMLSNEANDVNMGSEFSESPLLFGQIQTMDSERAARLEFQNVSTNSFTARLRTTSNTLALEEEVGWLAMEEGQSGVGLPYEFKRVQNSLATEFNSLTFDQKYGNETVFIGQTNGMTGGDIINLRYQKLNSGAVEVLIQEEVCSDAEIIHYFTGEVLEYMTFGREGFLNAVSSDTDPGTEDGRQLIVQSGTVEIEQQDREDWVTVTFPTPMENPVVVMGPVSFNGPDPVTTRVRAITTLGFDVRIEEWSYLDGAHFPERISWMAVEEGAHRLEDGTLIEAGFGSVDHTDEEILFDVPFNDGVPLVFAQVSSLRDPTPVSTRIKSKSEASFTMALEEEEAQDDIHAVERISWVAFSNDPTNRWQGGELVNAVNHTTTTINFDRTENGRFFAAIQSYIGPDVATVRLRSLDAVSADIFLEEEQSADAEIQHFRENLAWLLLEDDLYTEQDRLNATSLRLSFEEVAELEEDFLVYPNPLPMGALLTIELSSLQAGVTTLQLFDITGVQARAYNQDIVAGNNVLRISVAGLVPGIYVLQTEVNGTMRSAKLVIQ